MAQQNEMVWQNERQLIAQNNVVDRDPMANPFLECSYFTVIGWVIDWNFCFLLEMEDKISDFTDAQ